MGGILPIVFSEIRQWMDEYSIRNEEHRDRTIIYVQALDRVYLDYSAEKNKAATKLGQ